MGGPSRRRKRNRKNKHEKLAEGVYRLTVPGTHRQPERSWVFIMPSATPLDITLAMPPKESKN